MNPESELAKYLTINPEEIKSLNLLDFIFQKKTLHLDGIDEDAYYHKEFLFEYRMFKKGKPT